MKIKIEIPIAEVGDPDRSKSIWGTIWEPQDKRIEGVVTKHLDVLARKRLQLLAKNEYGKYVKTGWQKELAQFVGQVLIPEMPWHHPLRRKPPSQKELVKAAKIVERLAAEASGKLRQQFSADFLPADGASYERYCHQLLIKHGWTASLTKATGDQGVDILGSYEGRLVVFQCKNYAKPIGNKAVQEVSAGRLHHRASAAVIVCTADYTSGARQLAATNNVILIHHSELGELSERIIGGF
jgi:restriction system protein